ncbi:MAG: hypothetical protein WD052_01860 [Bacteroidales bacterium]
MRKHNWPYISFIFLFLSETVALTAYTSNSVYYVDKIGGNDLASGLSEQEAWSSLEKVNETTFSAGDTLLFKSGETWSGSLSPKGSGTSELPIVIDKYGSGSLPHFDGRGIINRGVLYLENQSGWEISNLEITNDADSGDIRRGVEICGRNGGLLSHIHLKNLHVHHIKGIIGNKMTHKRTGGIFFSVYASDTIPTRFDDILIENCTINDCENQGIVTSGNNIAYPDPSSELWQQRKFTNVVIRKNVIYNISKNAMILRLLDGGLVERNLCYATATGTTGNTIFTRSSRKVILQYNEGYDNRSPDHDGSLYDADLESVECIFQYSYSHDNAHGLYWQCTVQQDHGNIVRYNISQNDKGRIFNFSYPSQGTEVYNNTVFIGEHRSPVIIGEKTLYGGKRNYTFKNNLIINRSSNASYIWVADEFIGKRDFSNNLFYGSHPAGEPGGPGKLIENPQLEAPGTGENGLNSLEGYALKPKSPCIDNGALILNNGGMDFFGNPLDAGSADIGAFEFRGIVGMDDHFENSKGTGFCYDQLNNEIRMTLPLGVTSSVQIDVVNLQGKILNSTGPLFVSVNDRNQNIPLPDKLRPGIYFVYLHDKNKSLGNHAFVVL